MNRQISIISLLLVYAVAQAQKPAGLVARYSFNHGTAENDIGHEHTKVVGATLTTDRFGNENYSYYLHGNYESYLNLGTSKTLKPDSGSISLWFNMDNVAYSGKGYTVCPLILTKSHAGDNFFEGYSIAYHTVSQKLIFTSSVSEEYQVMVNSNNRIKLVKWYHVVITYNEKFICLYLDGILEGKMGRNFRSAFLENDSVMVGNSANTKNKRFFNGSIDDIEFYNRVLTPEEVTSLYNAPDPNPYRVYFRWALIVLLSGLGIAFIVWLFTKRYKIELEREKDKNKLQRQMYEMEMQVMKAQMNPHFIFNAMNSVQQFILAGDNENAHKYLGKFSKLLRKILESNKEEYISLENEIDMLTNYIELESLRFEQSFRYEIITDKEVINSKVKIPQMLIQPLVENAIWHGLLPKKGDRSLMIKFECISKKLISCTVDDNGVGRNGQKPEEGILKEKSLAINFISQRLELMRKEWGEEISISIIDKLGENSENEGTRVIIVMPIMN